MGIIDAKLNTHERAANDPRFTSDAELQRIQLEIERLLVAPRNDEEKVAQAMLLRRPVGLG